MATWLAGYAHRKKVKLNHSGAISGYQKKIAIAKGVGVDTATVVYLNGKHKNWPNDIRFTKPDGSTLLDFWREESDATDGTWWVEYDQGDGDSYCYVYWGKASDTDASSGANTFEYFNDGSSTSGWSGDTGQLEPTTANGILQIQNIAAGYWGLVYLNQSVDTNHAFRSRMKSGHYDSNSYTECIALRESSAGYGSRAYFDSTSAGQEAMHRNADSGGGTNFAMSGWAADTYATLEIQRRASDTHFFVNDANEVEITNNYYNGSGCLITVILENYDSKVLFDWMVVRNYTATEPTMSVYPEETAWLAGYTHRKKLTITHTGAITGYQKKLSLIKGVGHDSGDTIYLGDGALNWPSDVRFTSTDGLTLLDFWREENDASDGTWWVEYDQADGESVVWLYWGLASATDASNITNAFPDLADHFDDSSFNTTLFNNSYNCTKSESGTAVTLSCINGGIGVWTLQSAATFAPNYAVRMRALTSVANVMMYIGFNTDDTSMASFKLWTDSEKPYALTGGSSELGSELGLATTDYHIYDVGRNGTTDARYSVDNGAEQTLSSYEPAGSLNVRFRSGNTALTVDWVIVRKYTAVEPTVKSTHDEAGWLAGYSSRKRIVLSHTGAIPLYQKKLSIVKAAGTDSGDTIYLGGTPAAWPNDIRFTSEDGLSSLDYWREESDADDGTWWAEYNQADGVSVVYAYWGKASDTDASSGIDTMSFFDDFADESNWDYLYYYDSGGIGSHSVADSALTLSMTTTSNEHACGVQTKNVVGGINKVFGVRMKATALLSACRVGIGPSSIYNGSSGHYNLLLRNNAGNLVIQMLEEQIAWDSGNVATGITVGTYYKLETMHDGDTLRGSVDSGAWREWARTNDPESYKCSLMVNASGSSVTATAVYDYVYVRAYIATEPTLSTTNETVTWLTGYGKRKRLTLSHAGQVQGYQKKLSLVAGTGDDSGDTMYLDTGALNWPYDIRFTKADGTTLLDLWREESDATDGTFWFEYNQADGNTDVYLYYADADATDASSGVAAFPDYFTHFANLTGWDTYNTTTDGDICTLGPIGVSSDARAFLIGYPSYSSNHALRCRMKSHQGNSAYYETIHFTDGTSATGFYPSYGGGQNNKWFSWNGANYQTNAIEGYSADTFHTVEIARNGSTSVIGTVDDANVNTLTNYFPTGNTYFKIVAQAAEGAYVSLDWLVIRNFTATEPTGTWGAEESAAGGEGEDVICASVCAALSSLTASLGCVFAVVSTIAGLSGSSSPLGAIRGVASTAAGLSGGSALVRATRTMSTTIACLSGFTATLGVLGTVDLVATIAGVCGGSPRLGGTFVVGSTAACLSSMTAKAMNVHGVSSTIACTSAVTAAAKLIKGITALAVGTSGGTAVARVTRGIASTCTAVVGVVADCTRNLGITSTVDALSGCVGALYIQPKNMWREHVDVPSRMVKYIRKTSTITRVKHVKSDFR